VLVSYEVSRILGARSLYVERVDAEMQLRRGFAVSKKDRALIVEDVITTGESARKVGELVEGLGAKVVGVGVIIDRSGGSAKFRRWKYERLLALDFGNFKPHGCPLCKEHLPLVRPGGQPHKPAG
jgi:orotate phosphoribosyltransferase